MTTKNLALLTEAALTVPKKGSTPAPKRLTSRTLPKHFAFNRVISRQAVQGMIDRERKLRFEARRNQSHTTWEAAWKTTSILVFATWAKTPNDAMFDALWTAFSELWVRGDVRRRTWPWDEDPLALMIEVNPEFWTATLDELEVERLLWPITGNGPYPRAKFHRVLSYALADQEVAS